MSFIGPTTERKIQTSQEKTFKIFLTQQSDGYWVATVLFAKEGVVDGHHEIGSSQEEAYGDAVAWVLSNIDSNAQIEDL